MITIKTKVKRIVFVILILIWMYVVFGFSSQNGQQSGNISKRIVELLFSEANNKDAIEYIVRKIAHFSLYAVGAIFVYGFTDTFKISNKKKIIITIVVGFLYAITDEIHQLFVLNRSGQATDVLIDTCGTIFTTVVILLNSKLNKKAKDITHIIVFIVLILAWMYVVFSFSNQDNKTSQEVSTAATQVVLHDTLKDTSQDTKKVNDYNTIIRKLAHFSLYTVGGVLLYCLIDKSNLKLRNKIIIALALGVVYSITDELHQYFISGRTANLLDVSIDSAGIAFGILLKIQVANRVLKLLEFNNNEEGKEIEIEKEKERVEKNG